MIFMPSSLTAATIALLVGLASGAFLCGQYKDARLEAQTAAARVAAAQQERKMANRISEVSNDYDKRLTKLNTIIADTTADYDRLRVKRCPAVPKVAATPAAVNATASGTADGDREIEVDLDRVAAEIIRLGGDLDRANEQIRGLQAAVKDYLAVQSMSTFRHQD